MSWPVFKLGEICKIISGSTPSRTKPELWNGYIHWITPKDLDESRILELHSSPETITDKGLKSCSTQILPVNSVLFSSRAPIGLVAVNKIPLCTNQGFKSLIPGEKTHYKYLAYWLKANRLQLQAMGNGATFKELSKSVFEKVEIPLPPLEVQKKIAAVLEKADALRRKREEQIKRLDDLLQATFLDMFGDPVTNPKGWDMVKLGEISHKITDGVHAKPNYTTEGKPFISVVNITSGKIIFDNCKFVSEDDFKIFTKVNKPEYGDILYTKVGATYGIPAFVDVHEDFCLYVSVCLIKPNHNLINSRFLAESMRMPYIKRQADNRIKGIGVPDLHLNQIREFDICYPPKALQQKFVDFCNKLEKKREQLKKQFDNQNKLFNSLMQRAFKGELELK